VLLASKLHVSIRSKLLLRLAHKCVQAGFDIGQSLANVCHKRCVEGLGQILCAAASRHVPVSRVHAEELALRLECIGEVLVALDILLRAVDRSNESKLERVYASRENVESVRAVVHKIELCEHTNGALSGGIDMTSELQRFRVDDVHVRGRDSQNNAVWLCNVLGDEVARLFFDVRGLISNGHLGQTWQIDQSQAQDVRGVDFEVDGLSVDALVRACDPVGLVFNLPLDFLEIVESTARNVVELSPFILTSDRLGGVRDVDCVVFGFVGARGGNVDELQDERSPCYNAATARKEITANNVLEDRGFSGRLRTDSDLGVVLAHDQRPRTV
jgi:hypothetical protein